MDLPLKTIIDEVGLSALARGADVPISTLLRWADKGKIPGSASDQRMRAERIMRAAERLRAKKTDPAAPESAPEAA